MTRIHSIAACTLLFALAVSACSPGSAATAIPTVVLAAEPGSSTTSAAASATIVPAQHAELGFPMTGIVKDVPAKVGDKVSKGDVLAALDTSILEAEVAEADANLRWQQINYTYLARSGQDQEHLDEAKADVAQKQALLDGAKARLAQATLTAPFDGTVASVDIVPGETVTAGQIIINLGDLSTFRVETTDLSEREAPKVQVGQVAQVSVPALGGTYAGKVADISRVASTIGGDVVYTVKIDLDTQPQGLMWGMTANVQIATGD